LPFPYPVAVKVLSGEVAHKSDIGGVVLGVADGQGLLAAIDSVRMNAAQRLPGTIVEHVIVQPMISGLAEVLVGYRVDRNVGPLVMVAAGGVLAEIARDLAYRLYTVCERKGWSQEALAYNSLVISWSEIGKLTRKEPNEIIQATFL